MLCSKRLPGVCSLGIALLTAASLTAPVRASSHMDAPLITLLDAANTTDVYAFVAEQDGRQYLATALAVYPFEEPGIGPNAFRFDDNVRYEIHVATGDDLQKGKPTFSYQFDFFTKFRNRNTILQSFQDVILNVGDDGQNLTQTYRVTLVDRSDPKNWKRRIIGKGVVPPNNQGNVTPLYNINDDGEMPAKGGVATRNLLDPYTQQSIVDSKDGYLIFAGQRDDGFYADIQAIFDGLMFRQPDQSFDSQGGFNVHTICLNIPLEEIGGDMQVAGVFATTSRRVLSVLPDCSDEERTRKAKFVQIGRQGNPLFCEGFVAIADKDKYNRTLPTADRNLFARYAKEPELAVLVNQLLFGGDSVVIEKDRTDLVSIFIPDLIRVDLSTGPARLAGDGQMVGTNPDDTGFSRLGIFGEEPDVLISQIQDGFGGGVLPGGWPNGRRFGDDVVDIAITALLSDLRDVNNLIINSADGIDAVNNNDASYHRTFPYAATPLNGRNHPHH